MKTVRIEGAGHKFFGMTDDRRGLITEEGTFWMYPECGADGSEVTEMPSIAPSEIRRITFDEPDLTGMYIDEVEADYQKYLDYWRTVTAEEHAREFRLLPACGPDDEPEAYKQRLSDWLADFDREFEAGRKRFLERTFESYRMDQGRQNAWIRHGTEELAEKYGYCDYLRLALGLTCRGFDNHEIEVLANTIRYEARYEAPEPEGIYLRNLKKELHTPGEKAHTQEVTHQRSAPDYSMIFRGEDYLIRYAGVDFSAKRNDGMHYVMQFLRHPRKQLSALSLHCQRHSVPHAPSAVDIEKDGDFVGAGEHTGASRDQADDWENARRIHAEIRRLEDLEQISPAQELELKELIEQREKHLRRANRNESSLLDDEMKKRATIKRAINRALRDLSMVPLSGDRRTARDAFVVHIRLRLMTSFLTSFSYDPEPGVDWQ